MEELIEGISNDVLALATTSFLGIFSLLLFLYNWLLGRRNTVIHPDSLDEVLRARQASRDSGDSHRRPQLGDDSCPICLMAFSDKPLVLETNCGHLFCADCLLHLRAVTNSPLTPISCPICRQSVSFLLRYSRSSSSSSQEPSTSGTSPGDSGDRARTAETTPGGEDDEVLGNQLLQLHEYNRRFSGVPRSIWEIIQDIPAIIRHGFRNLFSFHTVAVFFRVRSLAFFMMAFVYILVPIDLIPEALFGILGLVDDLFLVLCAATWFTIQYRNHVLQQHHL